jgi:hypothetical protein
MDSVYVASNIPKIQYIKEVQGIKRHPIESVIVPVNANYISNVMLHHVMKSLPTL